MRLIEKELMKENEKLKGILAETKERMKNVPEGRIYSNKKATHVEYYLTEEGRQTISNDISCITDDTNKKKGKYIRKQNLEVAKRIAQRDYDWKLIKNLEERIKAIEIFLKKYIKTDIFQIYEKTNEGRRALLDSVILSNQEYVRRWESVEYEGKMFPENFMEIYTDRGERVRSKSEKIIADRLNVLGIPYRYEYPLQLMDNRIVYPDFTLLNIDTRKEVYLEHCGLMDEQEYVDKFMYKLKSYERSGIYLGVNLFITYETGKFPFNTKTLDALISNLFAGGIAERNNR